MATVTLTNQANSPAGRGAAPTVQLNATDTLKLSSIAVGNPVTISSSSKTGFVSSIDLYGTSIRVAPLYENNRMDSSSTPGELNTGETLTITT